MKLKQENRHIVDVLFVLALFCVFAISALMLVTIGVSVYQKTADNMSYNYNSRTAFAYISEKIRQNDSSDSVRVGSLGDTPAVILSQEYNGSVYHTYLYAYENKLCELFVSADSNIGAGLLSAGSPILPIMSFELIPVDNDLFRIYIVTEDNQELSIYISTQSNYEQ